MFHAPGPAVAARASPKPQFERIDGIKSDSEILVVQVEQDVTDLVSGTAGREKSAARYRLLHRRRPPAYC